MSFVATLRHAAAEAGVAVDEPVVQACNAHYQLLVTWNRTHNLTRIVGVEEAVRLHYLDCLVPLLGWTAPRSFVDVGSGAGFPGLLAAVAWPAAQAVLVEPSKKRASFLVLAAAAMGLAAERVRVQDKDSAVVGERVLCRATFPPGSRRTLLGYAAKDAEIGVWGHPHDTNTWDLEVSTWGASALAPLRYQVRGIEERCLLRASAPAGR